MKSKNIFCIIVTLNCLITNLSKKLKDGDEATGYSVKNWLKNDNIPLEKDYSITNLSIIPKKNLNTSVNSSIFNHSKLPSFSNSLKYDASTNSDKSKNNSDLSFSLVDSSKSNKNIKNDSSLFNISQSTNKGKNSSQKFDDSDDEESSSNSKF